MPAFPLTRPNKDQYYPFQKKVLFYQKPEKRINDKMCALDMNWFAKEFFPLRFIIMRMLQLRYYEETTMLLIHSFILET